MYDFNGQRILVTGSTRGIGRAIAYRLGSLGARVGIHGRAAKTVEPACRELAADGMDVIPVPGDLSQPAVAEDVVSTFVHETGGLDALVNNAGGGKAAAFRAMSPQRWRATQAANTEAVVAASREAYGIMRRQGHGGIVNVASLAAHGPGKWMGADYAASKAAVVSVTRSLAFEAARFGIRVNAVSPGLVSTDMTAVLSDEMKEGLGIPLGRLGKPDEVAAVVVFLLSEDVAYVSGQVLHVDGGLWMRG